MQKQRLSCKKLLRASSAGPEVLFLTFRSSIIGFITCSGIAIIASAYAMNRARSLIVISAYGKQCQTQRTTCKLTGTFRLNLLQFFCLLGS